MGGVDSRQRILLLIYLDHQLLKKGNHDSYARG